MNGNLYDVRAIIGEPHASADADTHLGRTTGIQVIHISEHCGELSPIPHVAPLQMLVDLFGCQIGR